MEQILEIRDGCTTPAQLLKSKAFAQYLDIYKKQFIKELKNRENTDLKDDVCLLYTSPSPRDPE